MEIRAERPVRTVTWKFGRDEREMVGRQADRGRMSQFTRRWEAPMGRPHIYSRQQAGGCRDVGPCILVAGSVSLCSLGTSCTGQGLPSDAPVGFWKVFLAARALDALAGGLVPLGVTTADGNFECVTTADGAQQRGTTFYRSAVRCCAKAKLV